MKFVIQGLKITSECRYIHFIKSSEFRIIESLDDSCFYIYYKPGVTSDILVDPRIEVLQSLELREMGPLKIHTPEVDLAGVRIRKLIQNDYSVSQFVVRDLTKFAMNLDTDHCEILIPKGLDWDIESYKCLLTKNPYIEVLDSNCKQLKNIYSINISNKDCKVTSNNDFILNTKSKYTKYLLDSVTVQDSFISQLRAILEEYGIELHTTPQKEVLRTDHKISYRYSELGKQSSRKSMDHPLKWAIQCKAHVDFTLSTPELPLLLDFRTKYQNLDLVTNFTEFYTNDKLGRSWISNVDWSPIGADFNQENSQDDNGNIAFTSQFSADIYYYTVYDETLIKVQDIVLKLVDRLDNDLITQ